MGDCGVFSALGALESIIKIRENCADINPDLSEQYVLSCLPAAAQEYGKGCTYGVLPSNAYKYIMSTTPEGNHHNGITWESCFPYQARDYSQGLTYNQICDDWLEYLVPITDYGSIGGKWIKGYDYTIPDPLNPLPVIIIHGVKDEAVPYYGGWVNLTYLFRTSPGYMKSVNESVAFWVYHNQCEPEPLITTSPTGRVEIRTYVNGTDRAEVVLYSYLDGDHGWNPTSELSVNDIIWDFFESHPKQ